MSGHLPPERTVIVGASLSGTRAAAGLRAKGYPGELTLIGDETHFPPFDRPTFSKEVLTGDRSLDACRIAVGNIGAELVLGSIAVGLDIQSKTVLLDNESAVEYDRLIVATGTVPRLLPVGESVEGVFALRTMEDALSLRTKIRSGIQVVIVGAGFIGCEVAASCRRMGAAVTVVEALDRPLSRALGPRAGETIISLHEANGVKFRFGVKVVGITETFDPSHGGPQLHEAVLSDGSTIEADVLVGAIGVVPSTDWLLGSGLDVRDGLLCNEYCEAEGAEKIYGIGDVSRWFNPLFQRHIRIEHWTNAVGQARYIARHITSADLSHRYDPIPYFWSKQYDRTFQVVGIAAGEERAVKGPSGELEAFMYYSDGVLTGVVLLDCPNRLAESRRTIRNSYLTKLSDGSCRTLF